MYKQANSPTTPNKSLTLLLVCVMHSEAANAKKFSGWRRIWFQKEILAWWFMPSGPRNVCGGNVTLLLISLETLPLNNALLRPGTNLQALKMRSLAIMAEFVMFLCDNSNSLCQLVKTKHINESSNLLLCRAAQLKWAIIERRGREANVDGGKRTIVSRSTQPPKLMLMSETVERQQKFLDFSLSPICED